MQSENLVVMHVSVGIKLFIEKSEVKVCIYKSINHTCLNIIIQEQKSTFIIISWM